MKYLQNVEAKPFIYEVAGRCLQFTKRAFNIFTPGTNAWDEWSKAKYKHRDRKFPKGVSVPIFFDWSGNVLWDDGVTRFGRYGHAAVRHKDGKIYSSPLTGTGRAVFNSVEDLESAFGGMKYVGWTEDIAGKRIIEEEDMTKFISPGETVIYYRHFLGEEPDQWAKDNVVGKKTRPEVAKMLRASARFKAAKTAAANGTLKPQHHLPSELRSVYKAPVAPGFVKVTKELYEKG